MAVIMRVGIWHTRRLVLKTVLDEVISTGLEPVTYCLEGSCSIQLSYETSMFYNNPKLLLLYDSRWLGKL